MSSTFEEVFQTPILLDAKLESDKQISSTWSKVPQPHLTETQKFKKKIILSSTTGDIIFENIQPLHSEILEVSGKTIKVTIMPKDEKVDKTIIDYEPGNGHEPSYFRLAKSWSHRTCEKMGEQNCYVVCLLYLIFFAERTVHTHPYILNKNNDHTFRYLAQ